MKLQMCCTLLVAGAVFAKPWCPSHAGEKKPADPVEVLEKVRKHWGKEATAILLAPTRVEMLDLTPQAPKAVKKGERPTKVPPRPVDPEQAKQFTALLLRGDYLDGVPANVLIPHFKLRIWKEKKHVEVVLDDRGIFNFHVKDAAGKLIGPDSLQRHSPALAALAHEWKQKADTAKKK